MSLRWYRPNAFTCNGCGKQKVGSLYVAPSFLIGALDTTVPPGWWIGGDGSFDPKNVVYACSEKCADSVHAKAEKKKK